MSSILATAKQFPAKLEIAKIDNLSIRYAKAPREGVETLVLLSPWPESILAFLPIWDKLAEKYDLLAIDLPGFGGSEGRPEVIAPEAMGNFVVKAMHHFGIKRAHAVGPDIGTSTLLFAVANHPDAFSSVIIGSGGVSFPLEVESALKQLIEVPLQELQKMDAAQLINDVLSSQQNTVPDFVKTDYIAAYSGEGCFAESARFVRLYPSELPVLKERLASITTPVLVIMGKNDPFVPVSNGHYLIEHLPVARLEILDTGHFVWETASSTYVKLVLEWVQIHKQN